MHGVAVYSKATPRTYTKDRYLYLIDCVWTDTIYRLDIYMYVLVHVGRIFKSSPPRYTLNLDVSFDAEDLESIHFIKGKH